MDVQLAGLIEESVVDGPGMRFVIFTQGCEHHCAGCHNPQTHDPNGGETVSVDWLKEQIDAQKLIRGITFSGGEPLMQTEGLIELVKLLEGFDIAVYTGHELGDVPQELLERINYIKTGPFKIELKTTVKPFVGSTNQEFRRLR